MKNFFGFISWRGPGYEENYIGDGDLKSARNTQL